MSKSSSASGKASDFTIIIDGREQKKHAYSFDSWNVDTVRRNLARQGETGDYSVDGYTDRFAVERKSLNDLTGCCGSRRQHFKSQVEAGSELDRYAVVIEASRNEVEDGQYYSEIHPNAVLGTVKKWSNRYGVAMFWNDNKAFAEVKTYSLLRSWWEQAKQGVL